MVDFQQQLALKNIDHTVRPKSYPLLDRGAGIPTLHRRGDRDRMYTDGRPVFEERYMLIGVISLERTRRGYDPLVRLSVRDRHGSMKTDHQ